GLAEAKGCKLQRDRRQQRLRTPGRNDSTRKRTYDCAADFYRAMNGGRFKAAMIHMLSGRQAGANIDAAVRYIGDAKSAGAEYVLTPEMTNILAANREQLFAVAGQQRAYHWRAT